MKQSYLRKTELKPLNNSEFGSKRSVLDYQQYEEQLASYEKNKKGPSIVDLFDWSKPSEIITLKQPRDSPSKIQQQDVIKNNSMNTDQLLRSDGEGSDHSNQSDLDDSMQIEIPSKASPKQSYSQQVKNDYGFQYKVMGVPQLETQLKEMREKIIEMNAKLNKMLDRYELLAGTGSPKQTPIVNPYQFLSKQIEINNKFIAKQIYQMKQIEEKDKQLEKKDVLVELNELIIEMTKEIHDMGKDKHNKWVDVQRIDRLLKQIQSIQGTESEYREVKELKIKIVFYFKKLKERKVAEEQLDQQYGQLYQKDQAITHKLEELTRLAVSRCLQVSTNKHYLQMKKRFDELTVLVDTHKKKKQVIIKSQKVTEDRIEKEIQAMTKEMQKTEMQTQQLEYKSVTVDDETNTLMSRHSIPNRDLKSISYRFDESLIHPQKAKHKPDFKRVISRMDGDKTKKTIDIDSVVNTKKHLSINDKNIVVEDSSDNAESERQNDSNLIKMKPILRNMKGKTENPRYSVESPNEKYRTVEASNIFKPAFHLKSKR